MATSMGLGNVFKIINEHFKNCQKLPDIGVPIIANFSFSPYYNSFREIAGNSASYVQNTKMGNLKPSTVE